MSLDRNKLIDALPGYDVGDELGRGAFGVVVSGHHRQLGRQVAIKQLPQAFGADPEVRARFAAEARVLASLDHPHIVPIFDYVEKDGLCLLVMELLPGGSVRRQQQAGVTHPQACAIGLATCAALDYAHEHGVLHRDIKPDNLLFTASRMLKVTDFGIAKVVGQTMATRAGEALGTPAYMAPEQCMGRQLGPATDVYATGVTLYELMAGRLPFSEDANVLSLLYRHVHEPPPPLASLAKGLPDGVAFTVMRALAKDPHERHRSAESFGVALAEAATTAWGVGWLAAAGMNVMAVGPIHAAAQRPAPPPRDTGRRPTVPPRPLHDTGERPAGDPRITGTGVAIGAAPTAEPVWGSPAKRSKAPWVAGGAGAVVLAAALVAAVLLLGGPTKAKPLSDVASTTTPTTAPSPATSSAAVSIPGSNQSATSLVGAPGSERFSEAENLTFYYLGASFHISHIAAAGGNYVIAVGVANQTDNTESVEDDGIVLSDGRTPLTATLDQSIDDIPPGATAQGNITFQTPSGFDAAHAVLTVGDPTTQQVVVPFAKLSDAHLLTPIVLTHLGVVRALGPDKITVTSGEVRFDDPATQDEANVGQAIVELTYSFSCGEADECELDPSNFLLTIPNGTSAGSFGSDNADVNAGATAGGFQVFFPVPYPASGAGSYALKISYQDDAGQNLEATIPIAVP